MNFPAAMAGRRVSPYDGLNLNRSFPGDPEGSPTQQIAHYIATIVLPMADAAIDLHSARLFHGRGAGDGDVSAPKTKETMDRMTAAARLFGFPLAVVMDDLGERRTIDALCRDLGIMKIGTELAGLATVSYAVLRQVRGGLWRYLRHVGVLDPDWPLPAESAPAPEATETRLVEIAGADSYVYATGTAIFEPNFVLGAEVREGDVRGMAAFH